MPEAMLCAYSFNYKAPELGQQGAFDLEMGPLRSFPSSSNRDLGTEVGLPSLAGC